MLYYIANLLTPVFGPARLLQSYTVLISLALYTGYLVTCFFMPRFYKWLPVDRGREYAQNADAAVGKPTGSGAVFITFFVLIVFLFVPLDSMQVAIIILTWLTMLTGFLDDRSAKGWGEYRKGLFDLIISIAASFALYYLRVNPENGVVFWLPFIARPIQIAPVLYITISTIILWVSINTTNCTDGVDGLSSTQVLIGLITMGSIFYFIIGHKEISSYLLVPHLADGAQWAIITFALSGVLMGYLWHNAFPSTVLMGDAGSRALGFFTGATVMVSGNPFLIFATSSIIMLNGGMGLLKVFLLRFFKVRIFTKIRFPLHDHVRKIHNWSTSQVLIKFLIIQVLITIAVLGIIFKIR